MLRANRPGDPLILYIPGHPAISGERSTYCMFRAARPSELLIEVGLRFTELIDDDRVILYVTVAVEDSAYDEDSLSAKFEHCWSILYVSISHE